MIIFSSMPYVSIFKYCSYLLVINFVILGCNSSSSTVSNQKNDETDLQGIYKVTELNDRDVSQFDLTMQFDTNSKVITGNAGCNTYNCSYNKTADSLSIQQVRYSKKMCPNAMQIEKEFIQTLKNISELSPQKNNTVSLTGTQSNNQIIIKRIEN